MQLIELNIKKKQFSVKWLLTAIFEVDCIEEIAEINRKLSLDD